MTKSGLTFAAIRGPLGYLHEALMVCGRLDLHHWATINRYSPGQTNFLGYSSFWDTANHNSAFQGCQMRSDSLKSRFLVICGSVYRGDNSEAVGQAVLDKLLYRFPMFPLDVGHILGRPLFAEVIGKAGCRLRICLLSIWGQVLRPDALGKGTGIDSQVAIGQNNWCLTHGTHPKCLLKSWWLTQLYALIAPCINRKAVKRCLHA